jgi:hypothetical protein
MEMSNAGKKRTSKKDKNEDLMIRGEEIGDESSRESE